MNILRDWIVGITGAAAVAAVSLAVSPEGRVKRVVSLVCGLVVIIALIAPISDFDYLRFRDSLFSLHEDALAESAPALEVSEKLTRTIIEEKYAAYIWDKGAALGMTDLEVGVTVCMSADGAWLPQSATIATTADKTLRDKLAYAIETGLGLPPEELIWRVNDEN